MSITRILCAFFIFNSALFAAEDPYKVGELSDGYQPTATQLRQAASQGRSALRMKRQPSGPVLEYYAAGVTTLDNWLGTNYRLLSSPPDTPSYYRFVYHGGRPVANYRNDQKGEHLSTSYFYDERQLPLASVLWDKNKKPQSVSVLTYDKLDRVKRVVSFNGDWEPTSMKCFIYNSTDSSTETLSFDLTRNGMLVFHSVDDDNSSRKWKNGELVKDTSVPRSRYFDAMRQAGITPYR